MVGRVGTVSVFPSVAGKGGAKHPYDANRTIAMGSTMTRARPGNAMILSDRELAGDEAGAGRAP
jgi:hypothetical protein